MRKLIGLIQRVNLLEREIWRCSQAVYKGIKDMWIGLEGDEMRGVPTFAHGRDRKVQCANPSYKLRTKPLPIYLINQSLRKGAKRLAPHCNLQAN
jgi:hypothetical protein